ncbi:YecA family protein [gamma proteobacterium HTCC5015]|nr:YecA family protein [gamma proteobacterium HTCC5015]
MIEFAELESYLMAVGAPNSVAETHGATCGLICAGGDLAEGEWAATVLGSDESEVVSNALQDTQPLALLKGYSAELMSGGDMGFDLMLPDEDELLPERIAQLGQWCQGFLYGFGVGGMNDLSQLDEASREVIDDFLAISQVGTEGIDEDEAEEQLTQLQEYVRVGVLLLFETLNPVPQASTQAPDTLQ